MTTKPVVITPRPKVFLVYYKLCEIPLHVMNLYNVPTHIFAQYFRQKYLSLAAILIKQQTVFCECNSLLKFQIRLVYLYTN